MDPSKPKADDDNNTKQSAQQQQQQVSTNTANSLITSELARQLLQSQTSATTSTMPAAVFPSVASLPQPQQPATSTNEDTNTATALLLRLMLNYNNNNNNNRNNGQQQQQQQQQQSNNNNNNNNNNSAGSTGNSNSLLLMQQLAQSDPNAIARLATCSKADLKAANLQAQALLREQEETLRNTRLLLQQQLEQVLSDQDTTSTATPQATVAAAAAAAGPSPTAAPAVSDRVRAPSPPGERPSEKRPPPQEIILATQQDDEVMIENAAMAAPAAAPPPPAEDESSDGGGGAGAGAGGAGGGEETQSRELDSVQYDDDELNDDDYFKNFDKEDSHKVNNETFPFRLYRMLYEVEKSGKQDVASFSTDGQMFCVRKPKRFVEEIMPQYFTTSRLASFQRQLNLYGFQRVSEGGLRGSYYHTYFKKGKRALCRKIKRQRTRAKPPAVVNSSNIVTTNQSGPVLSLGAAATATATAGSNSLNFNSVLPLAGTSPAPSRNSLLFTNAAAAAELLRRAAASMEIDRAIDTRAAAGLTALQGLLQQSSAAATAAAPAPSNTNTTTTLGNLVAAAAPAPASTASLISTIQNSPSLRRSLTAAPDPSPSPAAPAASSTTTALDVQQALIISRLQRENEELAQRLQAERDTPKRKRDPL